MALPTAKELMQANNGDDYTHWEEIHDLMIAFADIHVRAALQKASEDVFYTTDRDKYRNITGVHINKDSILNAYPSEKIK